MPTSLYNFLVANTDVIVYKNLNFLLNVFCSNCLTYKKKKRKKERPLQFHPFWGGQLRWKPTELFGISWSLWACLPENFAQTLEVRLWRHLQWKAAGWNLCSSAVVFTAGGQPLRVEAWPSTKVGKRALKPHSFFLFLFYFSSHVLWCMLIFSQDGIMI